MIKTRCSIGEKWGNYWDLFQHLVFWHDKWLMGSEKAVCFLSNINIGINTSCVLHITKQCILSLYFFSFLLFSECSTCWPRVVAMDVQSVFAFHSAVSLEVVLFTVQCFFFFPSWNELGQEVKELGIWVASACRMSVGSCGNGSLDHGPHPCCCLSTDPVGSSNSSHGTRMIFLFNLAIPP